MRASREGNDVTSPINLLGVFVNGYFHPKMMKHPSVESTPFCDKSTPPKIKKFPKTLSSSSPNLLSLLSRPFSPTSSSSSFVAVAASLAIVARFFTARRRYANSKEPQLSKSISMDSLRDPLFKGMEEAKELLRGHWSPMVLP